MIGTKVKMEPCYECNACVNVDTVKCKKCDKWHCEDCAEDYTNGGICNTCMVKVLLKIKVQVDKKHQRQQIEAEFKEKHEEKKRRKQKKIIVTDTVSPTKGKRYLMRGGATTSKLDYIGYYTDYPYWCRCTGLAWHKDGRFLEKGESPRDLIKEIEEDD